METFHLRQQGNVLCGTWPLISEENHTSPLFHASAAATHLHTRTHSSQQVQACIDRRLQHKEDIPGHTRRTGSETVDCHTFKLRETQVVWLKKT